MKDEALLVKLEEIRKSMESFNLALVRVRYDDYKGALYEQISAIFGDNSDSLFDSGLRRIRDSSACPNKQECVQRMDTVRGETMAAFQREDIGGAIMTLEDAEADMTREGTLCRDEGCSRSALEMIHQVKVLLNISDNLMFRNYIQPETGFTRLSSEGRFFSDHRRTVAPEISSLEASEALVPLSSPIRLDILKLLVHEERTFTEMSRSLGLKTGHLQFHLKVLKEGGLIRSNRRRRMYSITSKGLTAMEGLQTFVTSLSSKRRGPKPVPQ